MTRLLLAVLLLAAPAAWAQTPRIDPATAQALALVAEDLDAGREAAALERLDVLARRRLRPAARALVERTRGYILARQERYDQAIAALRAALATGALEGRALQDLRLDLGQLLLAQGKDSEGLKLLDAWRADGGDPSPALVDWLAYAYYRSGRREDAAELLDQALRRFPPRRSWYELRAVLHQEAGELPQAEAVLQSGLDRYPDALGLWRRLAAVQLRRERPGAALASLMIAHAQGILPPEDLVLVARLYRQLGAPYHGARLLRAALADGRLSPDAPRWGLVGEALAQARERDQAIVAFAQAARHADDGRWDLRRGELLVEAERWQEAQAALASALEKGLDSPGRARYLLAVTLAQQGKTEQARQGFRALRQDPHLGPYAQRWLQRLG